MSKATIKFTKKFAGKEKGDEWVCSKQLASQLVHGDNVAVYTGASLKNKKVAAGSNPKEEEEKKN